MDRLVLGESQPAPPPPMVAPPPTMVPPSLVEARSEAAGSEMNYTPVSSQPPPLMIPPLPTSSASGERSQAIGSEVYQAHVAPPTMVAPPPMMRPPSANSTERSEAVGSEINTPVSTPQMFVPAPPPQLGHAPLSMANLQDNTRSETIGASDQTTQSSDNQRSEAVGSEQVAPPPQPTLVTPSSYFMPQTFPNDISPIDERSEAAGSDRREPVAPPPQIVATPQSSGGSGIPPPPISTYVPSIATPTAPEVRSEAAGSDIKEAQLPIAPPPSVGVAPPHGRNVTGSDERPRRPYRKDESEEDSAISRESEKRNRQRRQGSPPQHRNDHRKSYKNHRRRNSPYGSRSSSLSDDDSYFDHRRDRDRRKDRNHKSIIHVRSSKKSYNNRYHNNDRSYR